MRTQVRLPGANRGATSPADGGGLRADRGVVLLIVLTLGIGALLFSSLSHHERRRLPTIGPSMTPTILNGDRIDVDPHAYDYAPPRLGDIVGFQGPANLDAGSCATAHPAGSPCPQAVPGYEQMRLVKRIVGVPGDRIAFTADGHSIRNGEVSAEPFIAPCPGTCALPQPIVVPPGHYFMAGDNRPMSTDSRVFGAVPLEAIDGRVELGG
jgi:signal peptidase I